MEIKHFLTSATLMGCLICEFGYANSFLSFLYQLCIHTNLNIIPWQVCVGGGSGQFVYIDLLIDRLIYNQYLSDAGPGQSFVLLYIILRVSSS